MSSAESHGGKGSDGAAWLALLAQGKPAERAQAAHGLGQIAEPPPEAVEALCAQIDKERSRTARASELLAVGAIGRRLGQVGGWELLWRLTGEDDELCPRPPALLVRLAATLALGWLSPALVTEEGRALFEANRDHREKPEALPWNGGDLGGLIAEQLAVIEALDADRVKSEVTRLLEIDRQAAIRADERLSERILAPLEGREHEPLLEDLSDEQRGLLVFDTEHGLVPEGWRCCLDFGTPVEDIFVTWRRYLGLTPPGPLDRRIELPYEGEVRRWPIWKWLRMVAREQVAAAEVEQAIEAALSAEEIVDLCRDALGLAYGLRGEQPLHPNPRLALLHRVLERHAAQIEVEDLEALLYPLSKLGEGRGWHMRVAGWRGGPFWPPEEGCAETKEGRR